MNSTLLTPLNRVVETSQKNDFKELCYICMENKADVYLKPCRHTGLCEACLLEHIKSNSQCPICKQEIKVAYQFEYDSRFLSKTRYVIKKQTGLRTN